MVENEGENVNHEWAYLDLEETHAMISVAFSSFVTYNHFSFYQLCRAREANKDKMYQLINCLLYYYALI